MPYRNYSNIAVPTTLVADVTSSATTLSVGSSTGYPIVPFTVALDRTVAGKAEVVEVTAVSGNTWTVLRGVGGTPAVAHTAGASVVHTSEARDFTELNEHTGSGRFARFFLYGGY